MNKRLIVLSLIGFLSVGGLFAEGASESAEAEYPTRNIDFIIGYSPGGGNDLITRAIAPPMEELMGVHVVPSNLPGASGSTAAKKIAASEPCYMFGLYSRSIILIQYTGYGDVNIENFTPVAQIVEDTAVLTVPSDSDIDTVIDLVDQAKANPDRVRIGNGGTGGLWHLAAALLAKESGVEIEHVPYKGGQPALVATAAHEIEATITNLAEAASLVETGDLKMVAVFSEKRNPAFPDVATAKEQGLDFEYPVWRGIFTANGGPEDRVDKLASYIEQATKDPGFVDFVENSGLVVRFKGPDEFGALIEGENRIYRELLADLGLKVSEPK